MKSFAVIIPTYNGGDNFQTLMQQINEQSLHPEEVIVIDSSSSDSTRAYAQEAGATVITIQKQDFNHGKTIYEALKYILESTCYVIYLTQDVLLANVNSFKAIITMLEENDNVAVAYGRQLPHKNATLDARLQREFNYPAMSQIKTMADKHRLGIKTTFVSNSFAAYKIDLLKQVGGFPSHIPVCEDMYVGAKFLQAGYAIGYCAEAQVLHSHNYSIKEDWNRYFLTGQFQKQESWIIDKFGKSEAEGKKLVIYQLKQIYKEEGLFACTNYINRLAIRYIAFWWGKHN